MQQLKRPVTNPTAIFLTYHLTTHYKKPFPFMYKKAERENTFHFLLQLWVERKLEGYGKHLHRSPHIFLPAKFCWPYFAFPSLAFPALGGTSATFRMIDRPFFPGSSFILVSGWQVSRLLTIKFEIEIGLGIFC